jgi:two-component system response regulator DesR
MVSVLIADQHRLYSAALEALLRLSDGMDVVGHASSGLELGTQAQSRRPAVVVVDIVLPGLDAAIPLLQALRPAPAVLLLSGQGTIAELSQAMTWGAHGYLRKTNAPGELIEAIRTLAVGHQSFDPLLLSDVMTAPAALSRPSARELSTLLLIAAGLSNKEIASRLALSPGTVRNYVSAVILKTHARNRVDAIRIAREYAWI